MRTEQEGIFMIQIVVFVPVEFKDRVKEAMFEAGGGRIGHYDSCSFEHSGTGQFRPLKGSNAFVGQIGKVEEVAEVRIEMSCEETLFDHVISAMKAAHPYETPAYYGIRAML
jgi:structural toxin protein (hemagglutinin/hemolysin) RtxA